LSFPVEQTRERVLRRFGRSPALPLPRRALPAFAGLALPRLPGRAPGLITAAALAAAVLAGLTLHRSEPRPATGVRTSALIAFGGPRARISLPNGASLAPAADAPPLVTALLAADLWQAANAVYETRLLAAPAATSAATPSAAAGPNVEQLLQAQIRLTQAQLAYQAITQAASDAQLAVARDAVAAARAQVLAAQQAVQAANTATVTPTPPPAPVPTEADLQAAQRDVNAALSAFQRVQHAYTDDQIAAARTDLSNARQALAAAQAITATPAASATPAPAAASTPAAASPTPPVTASDAPAPIFSSGSAAPVIAAGPDAGTSGAGVVADRGAGYEQPPAAGATDSAGAILTPQSSAANASGSATPAATPTTVPTAARTAPAVATSSPAPNLAEIQQWAAHAQQTLDRLTAPPDPAALQRAADQVAAAQGRLSSLQAALAAARAATATPEPTPNAAPEGATGDAAAALSPEQQLMQAQTQYAAAQQRLLALSQPADPAAVAAARQELSAAQQAWQALLAQANPTLVAQVNADPQGALLRAASSGAASNWPDAVPFAWPARGPISSLFGPAHPLGIDIAQSAGLPVTAAASGVVSFSGGDPCCDYGYYVDISHSGGYTTRYGHLLVPSYLKPGDHVRQGQIIGLSGSTGLSTGPHLHFEIRLNGVPLDPLRLLAGALPQPLSR